MPTSIHSVPPQADPELTPEQMKAFVRNHFEQFVNQKDPSIAYRSFSADFLDHDEPGGAVTGPEAAEKMMKAAYVRWPDLHVSVEDILAEGDKVVVRNIWTATDSASARKIEFHGFVLWRFAKGKIVERWATLSAPQPLRSENS